MCRGSCSSSLIMGVYIHAAAAAAAYVHRHTCDRNTLTAYASTYVAHAHIAHAVANNTHSTLTSFVAPFA